MVRQIASTNTGEADESRLPITGIQRGLPEVRKVQERATRQANKKKRTSLTCFV